MLFPPIYEHFTLQYYSALGLMYIWQLFRLFLTSFYHVLVMQQHRIGKKNIGFLRYCNNPKQYQGQKVKKSPYGWKNRFEQRFPWSVDGRNRFQLTGPQTKGSSTFKACKRVHLQSPMHGFTGVLACCFDLLFTGLAWRIFSIVLKINVINKYGHHFLVHEHVWCKFGSVLSRDFG